MDDVIGKVFTINKIDNQGIRFEEMGFNFPCFVLEKVQKPTYRPFANAEEFKPYRSRWVKMKGSGVTRFNYYNNNGVYNDSLEVFNYQKLFDTFLFEDGSPCGVKI